jgi:Fe-S cluster biosynthesis and repair protein YggX
MEDSKVYRFKFADPVVDEISKFSQLHRDDDRIVFKEAWKEWTVEIQDLINDEKERLTALKYTGDIEDKMFKSARYYFRKKSTVKKAPVERRVYVPVDKEILQTVDRHIENHRTSDEYTPAKGYDQFCVDNKELLEGWVDTLHIQARFDVKEIQDKIKKTYKNRYYVLKRKQIEA